MKRSLIIFFLMLSVVSTSAGDDFCGATTMSFQAGERITFKVFYSVIGLYVDAGTAQVSVNKERYNNKTVFHIVGDGFSNPSYDWIFKVRDRYESYVDTLNLRPYKFIRNVDEGGYKKYENVTFNHEAGTAVSEHGVIAIPACVQDVVSSVFFARNVDYSKLKPGDRIPFSMLIDDEVFQLSIRFVGKETVKTKYGKFRAIKIKPMLIKGTIFEGGEKMTVWLSDDPNHIPLRIESPITVGSVKIDMMGFRNLKYPLSSNISVKL